MEIRMNDEARDTCFGLLVALCFSSLLYLGTFLGINKLCLVVSLFGILCLRVQGTEPMNDVDLGLIGFLATVLSSPLFFIMFKGLIPCSRGAWQFSCFLISTPHLSPSPSGL